MCQYYDMIMRYAVVRISELILATWGSTRCVIHVFLQANYLKNSAHTALYKLNVRYAM